MFLYLSTSKLLLDSKNNWLILPIDKPLPTKLNEKNNTHTFQSKNSGIGVHKCGVCSNWPPQRLIWHIHINNYHTILRRRLADTYIFIGFHGNICKRDELLIDSYARQLQFHNTTHKIKILPNKKLSDFQLLEIRKKLESQNPTVE